MKRVSFNLTKVLGLNPTLAWNNVKTLRRVCRSFGFHNAQWISLRSCARRDTRFIPKNNINQS